MIEDSRTQATLLLTVSLGAADRGGAKPLSAGEWARLVRWLDDREADPSALMGGDVAGLIAGWEDRAITADRLDRLLGRGPALGLSLEKWYRAGLWILTRSDPAYPMRLERRLGSAAPPVLFGCGATPLLDRGGLAVVGSRDAGEADLEFARRLGEAASRQGHSLVSGGARGIDRTAMRGALESEGTSLVVLADGLLAASTSRLYRRPLSLGDLVLVSTVNPEARFHVGNAMARNRYIYCLAEGAVVVASARASGGTWNGACENLAAGWVPLWVKETGDPGSGNAALAEKGGCWLRAIPESIAALFDRSGAALRPVVSGLTDEAMAWSGPETSAARPEEQDVHPGTAPPGLGFYDLFLARLAALSVDEPAPEADLAARLELAKGQVKSWLKRGVAEGSVEKLTAPLRYRSPHPQLLLDGPGVEPSLPAGRAAAPPAIPMNFDFYALFLARLAELTSEEARSSQDIAHTLEVAPGQVHKWLKRGVADAVIHRESKPARYRCVRT